MVLIFLSFLAFVSSLSMLCLHHKMLTLFGKVCRNVNFVRLKMYKSPIFGVYYDNFDKIVHTTFNYLL